MAHLVTTDLQITVPTTQPKLGAGAPPAAAFEAFYAEHHPRMVGLAYALTGSWSVAEDLAQEAFVRVLRDWRKVERLERPDAWARRIVLNLSASRFRRLGNEARALARFASRADRDPITAGPDAASAAPDFWKAVRQLPRRQGQAIALHYIEDLPVDEVAEAMGCAVGTAKAHLHAARAALAGRLEATGHVDPVGRSETQRGEPQ